jgi:hypothetical protein
MGLRAAAVSYGSRGLPRAGWLGADVLGTGAKARGARARRVFVLTTLIVMTRPNGRWKSRHSFRKSWRLSARPDVSSTPRHLVYLAVSTNSHMEVSHATQSAIHHQDGRSVEASDQHRQRYVGR